VYSFYFVLPIMCSTFVQFHLAKHVGTRKGLLSFCCRLAWPYTGLSRM